MGTFSSLGGGKIYRKKEALRSFESKTELRFGLVLG
jgi:hypothetical protein